MGGGGVWKLERRGGRREGGRKGGRESRQGRKPVGVRRNGDESVGGSGEEDEEDEGEEGQREGGRRCMSSSAAWNERPGYIWAPSLVNMREAAEKKAS